MQKRIGFVGIVVEDPLAVQDMNFIMNRYRYLIIGRMGIPRHDGIDIIVIVVEGENDEIGALSGRLGAVPGLSVRSVLSNYKPL